MLGHQSSPARRVAVDLAGIRNTCSPVTTRVWCCRCAVPSHRSHRSFKFAVSMPTLLLAEYIRPSAGSHQRSVHQMQNHVNRHIQISTQPSLCSPHVLSNHRVCLIKDWTLRSARTPASVHGLELTSSTQRFVLQSNRLISIRTPRLHRVLLQPERLVTHTQILPTSLPTPDDASSSSSAAAIATGRTHAKRSRVSGRRHWLVKTEAAASGRLTFLEGKAVRPHSNYKKVMHTFVACCERVGSPLRCASAVLRDLLLRGASGDARRTDNGLPHAPDART